MRSDRKTVGRLGDLDGYREEAEAIVCRIFNLPADYFKPRRKMMRGYSLTIIPMSWALGRWDIRNKTLWAFGPLRFGVHRNLSGPYGGEKHALVSN